MTKYKIAEQVQRILQGNPQVSSRYHIAEVMLLIEQVANTKLRADYFDMFPEDGLPQNLMIYTYDPLTPVAYKSVSRLELPYMPISLPMNLGVLHVSLSDCIDEPFIPIRAGMESVFDIRNLLGSQTGYSVVGKYLVFTEPIEDPLHVRLAGVNLSVLSDTELLPISADMEAQIVQEVVKLLLSTPKADKDIQE